MSGSFTFTGQMTFRKRWRLAWHILLHRCPTVTITRNDG